MWRALRQSRRFGIVESSRLEGRDFDRERSELSDLERKACLPPN